MAPGVPKCPFLTHDENWNFNLCLIPKHWPNVKTIAILTSTSHIHSDYPPNTCWSKIWKLLLHYFWLSVKLFWKKRKKIAMLVAFNTITRCLSLGGCLGQHSLEVTSHPVHMDCPKLQARSFLTYGWEQHNLHLRIDFLYNLFYTITINFNPKKGTNHCWKPSLGVKGIYKA